GTPGRLRRLPHRGSRTERSVERAGNREVRNGRRGAGRRRQGEIPGDAGGIPGGNGGGAAGRAAGGECAATVVVPEATGVAVRHGSRPAVGRHPVRTLLGAGRRRRQSRNGATPRAGGEPAPDGGDLHVAAAIAQRAHARGHLHREDLPTRPAGARRPAPGGESRRQRQRAALRGGRSPEVRDRPGSGAGHGEFHPGTGIAAGADRADRHAGAVGRARRGPRPGKDFQGYEDGCNGAAARGLGAAQNGGARMKVTLILMMAALPLAAGGWDDDHRWKLDEKEAIRRTFDVAAGSGVRKLLVDNIHGFVHVTGTSGSQVQVSIEKHIYAESTEAMAEAKRDVKMDMSQQGNFVRCYEDGP